MAVSRTASPHACVTSAPTGASSPSRQWEYLVARDLRRPIFTFLVSGTGIVTPFEMRMPRSRSGQQQFIADFAKDRTALYYVYTDRDKLLDHIRRMELPLNVSAGRPTNLPEPIGTLFKGRADFLESLGTSLAPAIHRHPRQAGYPRHGRCRQDPRRHRIRLGLRGKIQRAPLRHR